MSRLKRVVARIMAVARELFAAEPPQAEPGIRAGTVLSYDGFR